jgi:hypothetical protein
LPAHLVIYADAFGWLVDGEGDGVSILVRLGGVFIGSFGTGWERLENGFPGALKWTVRHPCHLLS